MGTFILKRKRYGLAMGASMVADPIYENLIARPAEAAVNTVNEVDAERDLKAAQKQYGAIQAVGQVAKGIGKGVWNYGKNNKGQLLPLAGFSAALAGGTYGMNRIQRKKAEIDAGQREANGLSTGEKATVGATSIGAGALAAHAAGKSHDKAVTKATEGIAKGNALLKEANSKGLTKISSKAIKDVAANINKLNDLNKTKFGGISNKAFKMGRNGLIAGGVVAGAGLLANSMLKQKNNSLASVARLAKRSLGGKTVGQSIKAGEWGNLAKAGGTYVTQGAKSLTRGVSNFLTPGKNGARGLVGDIRSGLASQGEYGKKAADFLSKHKTAAMVAGAATVGSGAYKVADKLGSAPVNTLASLDKKTAEYNKNLQQGGN